jgi:hypothetical protein
MTLANIGGDFRLEAAQQQLVVDQFSLAGGAFHVSASRLCQMETAALSCSRPRNKDVPSIRRQKADSMCQAAARTLASSLLRPRSRQAVAVVPMEAVPERAVGRFAGIRQW